MQPFSVLISIYHKENPKYFKIALECVFAQTVQPNEIVLIEDGALTDELYDIINEFQRKYPVFNIIKNKTNIGLGLSLAKGVVASSCEYIVRMDTDDIIPIDRFEKEIKKLEEGYDVVSCWSLTFEDNIDNVIAIKKRPEYHNDIRKLAHKRSPMCHAGSAFRRSAVLSAGNYEHHLYYEDYDLWVRMLNNGAKFYNIQEVLYYVRTSRDMIARRGGWNYMMTEIRCFIRFYQIGFYSLFDVIKNIATHSIIRILPIQVRSYILKKIWGSKQR